MNDQEIIRKPLIFLSLDPTWRKWGVSNVQPSTVWFNTKRDAERFAKSGDARFAIAGRSAK